MENRFNTRDNVEGNCESKFCCEEDWEKNEGRIGKDEQEKFKAKFLF